MRECEYEYVVSASCQLGGKFVSVSFDSTDIWRKLGSNDANPHETIVGKFPTPKLAALSN
jgi:hypothetical protein